MKSCQYLYGASDTSRQVVFDRGASLDGCKVSLTSHGVAYLPLMDGSRVAEIVTSAMMTPSQLTSWLQSVETIHLEIAEREGEHVADVILRGVRAA
jgi:hypothetical protein